MERKFTFRILKVIKFLSLTMKEKLLWDLSSFNILSDFFFFEKQVVEEFLFFFKFFVQLGKTHCIQWTGGSSGSLQSCKDTGKSDTAIQRMHGSPGRGSVQRAPGCPGKVSLLPQCPQDSSTSGSWYPRTNLSSAVSKAQRRKWVKHFQITWLSERQVYIIKSRQLQNRYVCVYDSLIL